MQDIQKLIDRVSYMLCRDYDVDPDEIGQVDARLLELCEALFSQLKVQQERLDQLLGEK